MMSRSPSTVVGVEVAHQAEVEQAQPAVRAEDAVLRVRIAGDDAVTPRETEEEAEGDLADAVALGVVEALRSRSARSPSTYSVTSTRRAREVRVHVRHAARAGGPGTCAPGGADAGPRPRSRARRRSAPAARASTAPASSPGASRLTIGPTSPEAAQVGLDGLRGTRVLHLDGHVRRRRVVRARWSWPSDATRERLLVEVGEQVAARGRRGPARSRAARGRRRTASRAVRQRAERGLARRLPGRAGASRGTAVIFGPAPFSRRSWAPSSSASATARASSRSAMLAQRSIDRRGRLDRGASSAPPRNSSRQRPGADLRRASSCR